MKEPYYIVPDLEELSRTSDAERQEELRRRIAANIGDRETLVSLLGLTSVEAYGFYPDQQPPELSTNDTIDAFLERFGKGVPAGGGEEIVDEIPLVPAVDYLTLLEMEGEGKAPRRAAVVAPEEEEPPALTESFAKILIKNGNYSRALEILRDLSLKNPEKSIYFADQMRFLRKLSILQRGKGGGKV